MRKLRIFIADDHVVLREGLSMLIDAQPDMEVVGHAADGRSLIQQTQDCQADLVIMDVSMPGGGAHATAQLRRACPSVQVVADQPAAAARAGCAIEAARLCDAAQAIRPQPAA